MQYLLCLKFELINFHGIYYQKNISMTLNLILLLCEDPKCDSQ